MKKKISLKMQGANNPMFGKKGGSNHLYGKKRIPETRSKIRKTLKLRKENQTFYYQAKPVRFFNLRTNQITRPFSTLKVAAQFLGYATDGMLRKVLKSPKRMIRHEWQVIPLTQAEYLEYLKHNS